MNHVGMFSTIMTLFLLFSVVASGIRQSEATTTAWISMRSVYYFAGILVSGYYLNYLSGQQSTNLNNFSPLHWNHFVPLAFCILGLVHSVVVGRSRPSTTGYDPHLEAEDLMFKDSTTR